MTKAEKNEQAIREAKTEMVDYLADLRRTLVNRFPFSGAVSFTMDLVPVRDVRCETACTDGRSIYFDIEFLNKLNSDEALAVFAHEVWHNVMMHFMRTEDRDRRLFNIATDLEVNQILVSEGMTLPQGCLMPDQFNFKPSLSAEEYYDLLVKNQNQLQQQLDQESGDGDEGDEGNESKPGGNEGSRKGKSKGGRGGKGAKGFRDKHIYKDYDEASDGGNERRDQFGTVGFDDDFKPALDEKAAEQIRQAAVQAAQQIERQRGTMPAHLQRLVDKLLTPEMDWKTILSQFVARHAGGGLSNWSTPNRRFAYSGTFLPSHDDETIRLVVGIDTSGSTANDIPRFLGELKGLCETFPNYKLTLIQCDCELQDVKEYGPENPLDLENEKFEIKGMGGTTLKPIFDYVAMNDIEHDCIVVLTDGEIEHFKAEDAPAAPVLWMVTKGGPKDFAEFGEVHEFESSNK